MAGGFEPSDELRKELKNHVRKEIGALAVPDDIHFTASLPKTRSGKIMRRLLRDIAAGRADRRRHHDAGRLQRAGPAIGHGVRHVGRRVRSVRGLAEGAEEPRPQGDRRLAVPDDIHFTASLPKTRSGKIMRRLLRDIAAGRETVGDTSTLEDYSVLARLRTEDE